MERRRRELPIRCFASNGAAGAVPSTAKLAAVPSARSRGSCRVAQPSQPPWLARDAATAGWRGCGSEEQDAHKHQTRTHTTAHHTKNSRCLSKLTRVDHRNHTLLGYTYESRTGGCSPTARGLVRPVQFHPLVDVAGDLRKMRRCTASEDQRARIPASLRLPWPERQQPLAAAWLPWPALRCAAT